MCIRDSRKRGSDVGDLNKFCERMRYWCDEGNLGYDQSNRQDIRYGGECDCSSLVIYALKEAGFDTGAASYTGNLSGNLVARGWRRVSNNGRPCKGDVLLNDRSHVAAWLGDCLAQASIDERGRISGGKAGDQGAPNGRGETNTRGYYDYPWDCYLRWTGASVPVAPLGNAATRQAQRWLVGMGWSVGASGVDGSNGPDTHRALAKCLQATLNKYGAGPVSYTHLDVYKRQAQFLSRQLRRDVARTHQRGACRLGAVVGRTPNVPRQPGAHRGRDVARF